MKIALAADDDHDFIGIVDNVVMHIAEMFKPDEIVIVKVDNWFDHKWLRFSGKTLGALGIWKEKLTVPPFSPGRIDWERAYLNPFDVESKKQTPLHKSISGPQATQRKMSDFGQDTAIIWFSGNTNSNKRGSIMAYFPVLADHVAWYAGWTQKENWMPSRLKGVSAIELSMFTATKSLPEGYVESVLDLVHDEKTFLEFLLALSKDREDEVRKEILNPSNPYGPGANGWENGSIENFLEAAHACGTARFDHKATTSPEYNPWKSAAEILYSGKYYE